MLALFAAVSLDPLFNAPTLRGAHVGALVVAADTGRVVYSRNADDAFVPASTMKLLVGSAALERLGNAFSFTTSLETDGTNLYIRGGGDPTLSSTDLDDAATTLKSLSLTTFSGSLEADDSHFTITRYPDGWQVDDLPNDYAAPASALSYDDNALHIVAKPGAAAGAPVLVTTTPATTAVRVENDAVTGAAKSADTSGLEIVWSEPNTIRITGSVPLDERDGSALDAAMLDPSAVTLDLFAQHLARDGIIVGPQSRATTPAAARVLWQHRSMPLAAMLGRMWQPSDNLIAETLLDELGTTAAGDSRANGLAAETSWLRSVDIEPETLTIADGSGMSAYDRVTPRALVSVLRHDWTGKSRDTVLRALPAPGQPGTLEHTFTGTPLVGHLFAKTGTSNHTRTLAGYLQTQHGTFIFALMVNDWIDSAPDASSHMRAFQQSFLTTLESI